VSHCGACGAALHPATVFCTACGTRVPPGGWEGLDELTRTARTPVPTIAFAPPAAAARVDAAPPTSVVSQDSETQQQPFRAEELAPRLWWVLAPDGTRADVVMPIVLGRRPSQQAGSDTARLLALGDTDGTVSRNHARIEPSQPAVTVTNLSSKNTIGVEWPGGLRYAIRPGQHLVVTNHCVLRLGAATLLLQHA